MKYFLIDCDVVITKFGDVKITIGSGGIKKIGTTLDPIQLSIFSHRFMSIAEQMGRSFTFIAKVIYNLRLSKLNKREFIV